MEQLSGLDSAFLYLESARTPMHIGAVAIYDPSTAPGGRVRFKEVINFIEERLHRAKSFRQRIVNVPLNLDYPYWIEDPDFNIEFHIRHIALPQPGDWRQLCIQAARIHSRPMDLTKPLWEFTVVEGLDNVKGLPKGCYAIVSKVHHAAIDGVSGVDIMAATHSLDLVDEVEQPETPWTPERVPTGGELLARAYGQNLLQPLKLAGIAARSVPNLASVATKLFRGELKLPTTPNSVPRTRFNKVVSPQRVLEGRSFDLATIREMKSRHSGATVNDVILSVVGGGLRHYLKSKNELPAEPMIAMAPVSVRAQGEQGQLGNQVTAMSVSLGTHVSDPVGRLQFVRQSALDSKALTNAMGARQLADYTKFLSPTMTGLAARLYNQWGLANRFYPMYNTVVTNVPGPQVPIYSTGARFVTQYGLGPVYDGLGLFHPVFSYCGEITVSVNACRDMMPDPEFYSECLQESYDELKAGLMKRPSMQAPATQEAAAPKAAPKAAENVEGKAEEKTATKKPAARKTRTRKAAPKKATATKTATKKAAAPRKKPATRRTAGAKPKAPATPRAQSAKKARAKEIDDAVSAISTVLNAPEAPKEDTVENPPHVNGAATNGLATEPNQ